MGGHPWKIVSPYQTDVAMALADAQAGVFARGEYGFTYMMTSICAATGKPVPPLPRERTSTSIDQARKNAAGSGTRSILDVYDLGASPSPGVAGPFTSEVLLEEVGTTHPELRQVEAVLLKLYRRLGRGEAAYIICYEHDEPKHYLFMGMSFD